MKRPVYLFFNTILFTLFILILSTLANRAVIQYQLKHNAIQTQGMVTEIYEYQYAIVSFSDKQGKSHQLRISANNLNVTEDQQVPVWYRPEQPQLAVAVNPPQINWKGILPGLFFTIVFMILTCVFLISNIRFYTNKWRSKNWQAIYGAQIKTVQEIKYKIPTYWTIQLTCSKPDSEHVFTSHYFWTSYRGSERMDILNETITVYINPNDPQKYFVDTTELERKIREHDKALSIIKCKSKE